VFTELIRGDVYFWQSLMAAAVLTAITGWQYWAGVTAHLEADE